MASGDLCPDDLDPAGVDGECGWIRGRELPDGHGGLPTGGTLRVHRVQVSGLTSRRRSPALPAQHTEPPPPPRITRAGVTFDPSCPAGVSGVCVSGVSYLGNKLDFSFSEGSVTVEVRTRAGPWAPLLEVELWPSRDRLPLPPGRLLLPGPRRGPGPVTPRYVPSPPGGPLSLQGTRSPSPARLAGYKVRSCRTQRQQVLLQENPGRECCRHWSPPQPLTGPLGPLDPQSPSQGAVLGPAPEPAVQWALGTPLGCSPLAVPVRGPGGLHPPVLDAAPVYRPPPTHPPSIWQPGSWAPGKVWFCGLKRKTLLKAPRTGGFPVASRTSRSAPAPRG